MILTLQRIKRWMTSTTGDLLVDGQFVCHTLEDVVREVPGLPVAEWKIKGKTAIPAGRYRVTLEDSPRFGPATLTINDVPGYQWIRMHAGNTDADTEGCILLGELIHTGQIVGGTSRPAVKKVRDLVMEAINAGEEVWIEIENPLETA